MQSVACNKGPYALASDDHAVPGAQMPLKGI